MPEMHPVRAQGERDIRAVVDNYLYIVSTGNIDRFTSFFVKFARRGVFFAQLDKRRAAPDKLFGLLGVRQAGKPRVCDRVDPR